MADRSGAGAGPFRVIQGGRAKAYRPIARRQRLEALDTAIAAWNRGDWFEAHELLEPAWMGTDDVLERDLYQGLIKLAAAYVHWARGNPLGMAKNLAGAERRLARVAAERPAAEGFDLPVVVAAIGARLTSSDVADPAADPPVLARERP